MIALDPILQAAQDGDNHHPIIDIVSASFTEAIPFEGNLFNSIETDETGPDLIEHSTGRMVCVTCRGNDLVLLVTNTDKTEWAEYTIYNGSQTMKPAMCELDSGNIGIVFSDTSYRLYCMVVDTTGIVVTTHSLINDYATWISAPAIERLVDDSYILVYAYTDGSTYLISTRASSDFLTWGVVTAIAPSGFDNTLRIDNPDIAELESGELFLVFDYLDALQDSQELVNCYAMTSDDSSATWSTPTKITDYTVMGIIGNDPSIAERDGNTVEIAYTEENNILYMNENTTGWIGGYDSVQDMHYNASTNKLIFNQVYTGMGYKSLLSVVVVDVATWTIEKVYTSSSSPAYSSMFSSDHVQRGNEVKSDGKYAECHTGDYLMVIDTELDTITQYNFTDNEAYSFAKNVTSLPYDMTEYGWGVTFVCIDADNDRAYIACCNGYTWTRHLFVGYLDLTEEPDPTTGEYAWNPLFELAYPALTGPTNFLVQPDIDMILLSFPPYLNRDTRSSHLYIYSIASKAQLYHFDSDTDAGMQNQGAKWPICYNGHIYAGTTYQSTYGNGDRYGLMDINLSTGSFRYHRPSWGTYDNYNLNEKIALDDGRILISCSGYGITAFDTNSESWVLYNDDNIPGITTLGSAFYAIDYDPATGMIFTSTSDGGEGGVLAFSENGNFQQLKYITGIKTGDWNYSTAAKLTTEYTNSMPAITVDADNILWAVWSSRSITEQSLMWDCEIAAKNLTKYLTDDPVTTSWGIDSAATLSLTLSHGHLFDQSNSMSTLSPFLKKGRKIEVELGEKISGINYLQGQGTFIITETQIDYERDSYPVITVSCEDLRTVWEDGNITATEYFSDISPVDVISSLVQTHGNLDLEEISLPTINNSHNLFHQFIDQDLSEIVTEILEHFGYFLHFNSLGQISAKEIDLYKSVNHVYANEISKYTPDDSYSNFVNKVVVKGEGQYDIEVLYDLESVGSVSGTVIPFGGTKKHTIWYSEDREQTCRDPELVINTSIRDYEIFIMKVAEFVDVLDLLNTEEGYEGISYIDTDEKYIQIKVLAPDLTGIFIAAIANVLATGIAALTCTYYCGGYIFALSVGVQLIAYILGALAQYDYEIWARPIGYENQTFQAEANDLISQRELDGQIIKQDIDDSFCYTIQTCQEVADRELAVVQSQRNRVSFSKPTHLQDEIGDVIQINHPYTKLAVLVFVTSLTRTYEKGTGVTDEIEGWLM